MPKHRKRVLEESSVNNESIIFDEKSFKTYDFSEKMKQSQKASEEEQKSCCESLKQSIHNFYITMINYLQCDRILNQKELEEVVSSAEYKVKRKFTENYWETYSEQETKFGYSFEEVMAERIKEEEAKQKDCWTEFKRFICCEGGNELDEIDERWDDKYDQKRQHVLQSSKYGRTLKTDESTGFLNLEEQDEGARKRNIFDRRTNELNFEETQFGEFVNQPNTRVRKVDKFGIDRKRFDSLDIKTIHEDKLDNLEEQGSKSGKIPPVVNLEKVEVRNKKGSETTTQKVDSQQISDFESNGDEFAIKDIGGLNFQEDANKQLSAVKQNQKTVRKQHSKSSNRGDLKEDKADKAATESIVYNESSIQEKDESVLGGSDLLKVSKKSRKERKKSSVSFQNEPMQVTEDPEELQIQHLPMTKSAQTEESSNNLQTKRSNAVKSHRQQTISQTLEDSMENSSIHLNRAVNNKKKDRKKRALLIQSANEEPEVIDIIPGAALENGQNSELTDSNFDMSASFESELFNQNSQSLMSPSAAKKRKKAKKLRQFDVCDNALVIETDHHIEMAEENENDGYLFDEAAETKPKTVHLKTNLYKQGLTEPTLGTNKMKKRNKKAQMRKQLENEGPLEILAFDENEIKQTN